MIKYKIAPRFKLPIDSSGKCGDFKPCCRGCGLEDLGGARVNGWNCQGPANHGRCCLVDLTHLGRWLMVCQMVMPLSQCSCHTKRLGVLNVGVWGHGRCVRKMIMMIMEVFDQIIDVFHAFKDGRRTACVSSQACIPAKSSQVVLHYAWTSQLN